VSDLNRNRLHGIKISGKRMRLLNRLKKITNLTRETQDYINRYQVIYKRVVNEAKRGKMIGTFYGQRMKKNNVANNKLRCRDIPAICLKSLSN